MIDADTWDVGGVRVRLFGIDAPERDQTCRRADGSEWACGQWTTDETARLYQGRTADCRAVTVDRYQRVVARCTVHGADPGREMVQQGLAFAYRKYSMDYDLDEKRALVSGVGIHAAETVRPAEFRTAQRKVVKAPAQTSDTSCSIKGNISSKGVRIYHMPGQEHYSKTRISRGKGERWFCSEA
ncbi:MAG: thermonuclease family protein, partial [Pseudomonadota bacterium]|nr:thermonuclease family protein [Pseudomonadota bacterium]